MITCLYREICVLQMIALFFAVAMTIASQKLRLLLKIILCKPFVEKQAMARKQYWKHLSYIPWNFV